MVVLKGGGPLGAGMQKRVGACDSIYLQSVGGLACSCTALNVVNSKGSRPGVTQAKRSSKGESAVAIARLLSATFRHTGENGRTCQKLGHLLADRCQGDKRRAREARIL